MRQGKELGRFHYPPISDAVVRDGCYLTSMGHVPHPPGSEYPPAGHPEQYNFDTSKGRVFSDFGLVLISSGSGFFQAEGEEEQVVEGGDFMCLSPGRWHRYGPDPKTGWEEHWLCFNGDYPHRLLANGQLPQNSCLIRPEDGEVFRRRLSLILEGVDSKDLTTTLGMGLRALALFNEIATPEVSEKRIPERSGLCEEAMAWMGENLHRAVGMGQVANHLGVTRRTLERHFRKETGLSPGAFLIRSRVERARSLIETTDMPMKSVAFAAGFSSPQQMIYDFNRHTGMPPSRFRS